MHIRSIVLLVLIILRSVSNISAQLCEGSLGDPVVNITFGQGGNPGPPLGPGVTNYGYVPNFCPDDGFYSIGNSTATCFGDTWHTVGQDHTPDDVNGYMMIINASYTPGDFYVDTVRSLCASTTYEFAAWIANVIKADKCNFNTIRPNVTFYIETITGEKLLTYETGDISPGTPDWKQYGSFFTTPANTSTVVIRMTNNSTGGCGNDILLDDITFRPCGATVTSSINGATTKDLCVGDNSTLVMNATVSPSDANTFYQWQRSANNGLTWTDIPGANTTSYTRPPNAAIAATVLYRLSVAQGNNISIPSCRIASNIITVNVNAIPKPEARNNGPKCEGDTLTLTIASEITNYSWTGPNNFSSINQPAILRSLKASDAGRYYVSVTSDKGCTNNDSTDVTVNPRLIVDAGSNVSICQGNSVQLNGTGGTFYSWSPIANLSAANIATPTATPDTTTTYLLAVSDGICTAFDTVRITVLRKPVANAGEDIRMFEGETTILNGEATGGNVTFSWTPPVFINNPRVIRPTINPTSDITYTLTVSSTNGCGVATDNVFVRVFKQVKIPNAFSPNGDGINDVWKIEAIESYPEATISVFNRYGQLMYSGNGTANPWDGNYNGKPLPIGTYYYIIDLKNDLKILSGSLVLLK